MHQYSLHDPTQKGAVVRSRAIGVVVESKHDSFAVGTIVHVEIRKSTTIPPRICSRTLVGSVVSSFDGSAASRCGGLPLSLSADVRLS